MLNAQKLRLLLFPAIMMLVIFSLLLMNFTAPNPTGRRYSSADPIQIADDLNLPQPGRAAEEVLSWDLGVPRNDSDEGDRACICNESSEGITPPGRCNLCVAYHPDVSLAIPDFITSGYIADSKDYRSAILSIDQQMRNFLLASDVLNVPLYIYMPHPEDGNLRVSDSAREQIEATGGAVIPYFAYAGYVDSVDRLATIGLVLTVLLILGIVILQLRNNHKDTYNTGDDEPGKNDTVDSAVDMTDATEEFMKRVERLSRQELDDREPRSDDKKSD